MAMVINTNTASLTTQRHLSASRNDMEVAMERMSSGSRVNSSMDDAAGLAIGNRMTSQVEGLNQAVRNANDGISLSQTAEGALQSSSNILQRIRVLAVQAANDTYSAMDRKALNNEIVQLKEELNRGVNQAEFNGKKILNGTNASFTFQVGHKSGDNVVVALGDMRGSEIGTQSWDTKTQTKEGVPATATMTISGNAIKANDTITMTAGSATLAHTFAATADLATSAAAYVTAWNSSADANVSLYTASNVAGAITITEKIATTGALTVAGSVAQVGTSTAVPATATMTISGNSIKANDTMTMTVGSATLAHTFAATADLATSAAAYVTAWNNSSNANVSLYTASSAAGTITLTEDTATTGALTATGSVAQVGTSSAVKAESTLTFTTKAGANDVTTVTVGAASFTHDFGASAMADVTATALAFKNAWNASSNVDVAAYTATASLGVVTFQQDTASTGPLTASVVNSAAGAAVRSTIDAGTTGVVGVSAVAATDIVTVTAIPANVGETLTITIGDAVFAYPAVSGDLSGASATVTTVAANFVAAWNNDTDADVSKYVASNTAGAITFTQATASTGNITATAAVTGSFTASLQSGVTGVALVNATAATATQTFTVAAGANEVVEANVGAASFTYNFGATAMADVSATAAAFAAAWNASGDANVGAYTASASAGVVTYTQDTVTAGALTVSRIDGATTGVASATAATVTGVSAASNIAVASAAAAGTTGVAAASNVAVASAAAAGTTGVATASAQVTAPVTAAEVTAVTAIPATATMTISGAAIKATDTMTMTVGSATLTHIFAATADLATSTAAYVEAWNASTDANVSLFTASNVAGAITITQDTATAGALTVSASRTQVAAGSDLTIAVAAAAGTTGVAGVAEQESYDYSGITLATGDRVSLTIGANTYTQEFTTNQAATLNALGALVVNSEASYSAKTVDANGKLVFTGTAEGTALAAATAAVQTSSVSAANSVDDILVTDVASAKAALAVVDSALEMMSDFRARLGASSNRMFVTVDNLMSMSENTSAARSRIIDADFAAESASLAKTQVLQKAGTAMLSQANASTQDILSLLK